MRKCLLLLLLVAGASVARASEPRVHIMGIWPDRMRYFDEKPDDFVAELRVRRGAVWHHDAALLPDSSRLYGITDRLESVEVIDLAERAVVDEFKLSTDSRKVRLLRIAVAPSGERVYLSIRSVQQESDRLIPERPHIVVYDLDAHEVAASFEPPRGVNFDRLGVSPDGSLLLLFGRDIYLLSTTSYEIVDNIVRPSRSSKSTCSVWVASILESGNWRRSSSDRLCDSACSPYLPTKHEATLWRRIRELRES